MTRSLHNRPLRIKLDSLGASADRAWREWLASPEKGSELLSTTGNYWGLARGLQDSDSYTVINYRSRNRPSSIGLASWLQHVIIVKEKKHKHKRQSVAEHDFFPRARLAGRTRTQQHDHISSSTTPAPHHVRAWLNCDQTFAVLHRR
jgi:hypothetical protein